MLPLGEGMITTSIHPNDPFEPFVTRDPFVLRSLARLRSWSQGQQSVLLTGEAGVGKSLLGRLLHLAAGSSEHATFVLCTAAQPIHPAHPWATLDEHGGTVAIDGLEHWSLEAQARMVHRLASLRSPAVRVVAHSRVSEPRLRLEDRLHPALAQRWGSRVVEVPPLRARPDDLPLLVEGMLRRAGRSGVELEAATWRALATHGWPDNVRELRRAVDVGLAQAGTRLEPQHLQLDRLAPPALEALGDATFAAMRREVDAWYLRKLLHATDDNLSEAARRAGCSRKVLRERLRRHGLYAGTGRTAAVHAPAPCLAEEAVLPRAAASTGRPAMGTIAAEERVIPWAVLERARARRHGRTAA
jgi:two-component system nitrogen regulation response regulator GlnG